MTKLEALDALGEHCVLRLERERDTLRHLASDGHENSVYFLNIQRKVVVKWEAINSLVKEGGIG